MKLSPESKTFLWVILFCAAVLGMTYITMPAHDSFNASTEVYE